GGKQRKPVGDSPLLQPERLPEGLPPSSIRHGGAPDAVIGIELANLLPAQPAMRCRPHLMGRVAVADEANLSQSRNPGVAEALQLQGRDASAIPLYAPHAAAIGYDALGIGANAVLHRRGLFVDRSGVSQRNELEAIDRCRRQPDVLDPLSAEKQFELDPL